MMFNLEPCKHDKRGRNIADYKIRDHYEKLAEEVFEAHTAAVQMDDRACCCADEQNAIEDEAIELLHVMTVCASRIAALGLSDERLTALQQHVIEHNRERGYFKND